MIGPDLKLAQQVEQLDARHWRWSVWIDGPSDQLNEIKDVVYLLHPTFKDPVRTVTDRLTNFRLSSSGWGEFTIVGRLQFKDGSARNVDHFLRFAKRTPEPRKLTVFLSYGVGDTEIARDLAAALSSKEIEVVDASSNILPGAPISSVVSNNIDNADAVVAVMRSSVSSNVLHDAGFAQKLGKPVIWYGDADNARAVADVTGEVDLARDEHEVLQKVSELVERGSSSVSESRREA